MLHAGSTFWLSLLIQILESTDLIPLDGDVAKITRRAEEFKDLHESLQRNLPTYLTATMDALAGVSQTLKTTVVRDATRQMVCFHCPSETYDCANFAW